MTNTRGEINIVFIILVSVIIIGFCGFLALKFLGFFLNNSEKQTENAFLELLKRDYKLVFENYGAQKVYDYKVSSEITNVCFITSSKCIFGLSLSSVSEDKSLQYKDELSSIFLGGNNVILLDENGVVSSTALGKFTVSNSCTCIPVSEGRFSLLLKNQNNIVSISQVS
jgi:hypothetical protein